MLQTIAVAGGKIRLVPFVAARIPVAVLSAVYCLILQKIFFADISVVTSAKDFTFVLSEVNPVCSICIIFMSYILLKSTNKNSRLL